MSEFQGAILAGIAAAALLIAEHMLFWRHPWRLWPPAAYVVGTATLGACLTGWCWAFGLEMAAVAFWFIAGIGGATVVAAWWLRGRLADLRKDSFAHGQLGISEREGSESECGEAT